MTDRSLWITMVVALATVNVSAAADEKPAATATLKDQKTAKDLDPKKSPDAAKPYADAEGCHPTQGGCCDRPLVPVCRRVPTTKKKPKTEYDVKCELVCVPGCSGHSCGKRHTGCSETCSESAGCCGTDCCKRASIRPKKTLLKTVVDEEVDAWEYKVEWVCADCAAGYCSDEAYTGASSKGDGIWHAFHRFWSGFVHRH